MQALNGEVRDHVLREARQEIRNLASEGMSAGEISQRLNGDRSLSEAEQGVVDLLTFHTVAEAKGHF